MCIGTSVDDDVNRYIDCPDDDDDDDVDDDDDTYIMMKCLSVCHEKSSLPPYSLL